MPRTIGLAGYQRTPAAIIDPTNLTYLADELQRIEDALSEAVLMIPQPANREPPVKRDAMQRFVRGPWSPIGVTDVWVYWDALAGVWKLL